MRTLRPLLIAIVFLAAYALFWEWVHPGWTQDLFKTLKYTAEWMVVTSPLFVLLTIVFYEVLKIIKEEDYE